MTLTLLPTAPQVALFEADVAANEADVQPSNNTHIVSTQVVVSGNPGDDDGDGMLDAWETANGLDPADASDAALDPDSDGLTNLGEFNAGTDPNNPDTDGDGLPDGSDPNPLQGTAPNIAPILQYLLD